LRGNELFGHSTGDDVFRPASAVARAENLRHAIFVRPIHWASLQLTVSVSVGLAFSSACTRRDVEQLPKHSYMALYGAKDARRNCVRIAHPKAADKNDGLTEEASVRQSPLFAS